MLGKLLKLIFLPRRARHKLAAHGQAGGRAARRAPAGQAQVAAGRERILDEALAVYRRQQREVYEKLDAATRRRIEEEAAEAFGDVLGTKD